MPSMITLPGGPDHPGRSLGFGKNRKAFHILAHRQERAKRSDSVHTSLGGEELLSIFRPEAPSCLRGLVFSPKGFVLSARGL
jgi:hypothetical protein